MSSTEKRLENIKIALGLVEGAPLHFTKLTNELSKITGSGYRSENIVRLILKLGYLERPERGVYRITERGIKMLNGLRNSQKEEKGGNEKWN